MEITPIMGMVVLSKSDFDQIMFRLEELEDRFAQINSFAKWINENHQDLVDEFKKREI